MSSIRVSDRLRSKRFKTGNATAEDKAYIEKKYCGECDMNGYVSPFPPGEDPYFKEWTYTPLPSNYVEKKAQKKPKRALSKGKQKKAQVKFEEDMSKVVLEKERCEALMKEALEVKKPTLIIEEDDEDEKEQEKFLDQCAIDSLIQERKAMINSLYHLNQEIERLEKKWAQPRVIPEMTPEKFRNALSDLGYIKK